MMTIPFLRRFRRKARQSVRLLLLERDLLNANALNLGCFAAVLINFKDAAAHHAGTVPVFKSGQAFPVRIFFDCQFRADANTDWISPVMPRSVKIPCALRQNLLVGRLHMRVRAEQGRNATVQIKAERSLFRRGFRVKIHNFDPAAF